MKQLSRIIYIAVIALIIFPFAQLGLPGFTISAPIALLLGLIFAFIFPNPCPKFNKKTSKYLLQVAVVCLGFNMNLQESLKSGSEGMLFTVVSVVGVMCLGVLLGYWLHINRKTGYPRSRLERRMPSPLQMSGRCANSGALAPRRP